MQTSGQQGDRLDERVLVLAPTGRDGSLAVSALQAAGLRAEACESVRHLCDMAAEGAGVIVIADEALDAASLQRINEAISTQPAWSDIPIILLTAHSPARNARRAALTLSDTSNVTVMERPVRVRTLLSSVQSALRARRRQYEVRDHLAERARHEAELRDAAEREGALRRQAQEAHDRLELVLFGISDAFFIVDSQWRFTYANDRAAHDAAMPIGDMLSAGLWEVYPSLAGLDAERQLKYAMTYRTAVQFEYYLERSDRWRDGHAYPCPEGLAVFCADVTDRKRAEEVNREHSRRQQHIAETLQRSLLPPPRNYPGILIGSDYQAASKEAEIGGDFYDAYRIDETKVALVVGDVVGKGLAAATHTAEVKFPLRAILREDPRPGIAMERLNNFLGQAMSLEPDGPDHLVAMCIAVLDTFSGELLVAAAAAEAPIVLRVDGEILVVEARGLVLGASPRSLYEERSTVVGHGDIVIMFTDGITEARRGAEFFGLEGVLRSVQAAFEGNDLDRLAKSIIADAINFTGGSLRDDACVLVARRR